MKMYFHFGWDDMILFEGWMPNSAGTLFASMLAIIVFGIIYEILVMVQHNREVDLGVARQTELKGIIDSEKEPSIFKNRGLVLAHLLNSGLYIVRMAMAYIIMLVVMTYNLWLCFAVLIGLGIGYFLFASRRKLGGPSEAQSACH